MSEAHQEPSSIPVPGPQVGGRHEPADTEKWPQAPSADDPQKEAAAEAELQKITPPNADLLKLAEQFPAPEDWYDE